MNFVKLLKIFAKSVCKNCFFFPCFNDKTNSMTNLSRDTKLFFSDYKKPYFIN